MSYTKLVNNPLLLLTGSYTLLWFAFCMYHTAVSSSLVTLVQKQKGRLSHYLKMEHYTTSAR